MFGEPYQNIFFELCIEKEWKMMGIWKDIEDIWTEDTFTHHITVLKARSFVYRTIYFF